MKKVFMALAIASMAMFAVSCGNSGKKAEAAVEEEVVVEEACECCEGECQCDSTKCAGCENEQCAEKAE